MIKKTTMKAHNRHLDYKRNQWADVLFPVYKQRRTVKLIIAEFITQGNMKHK